MEVSGQLHAPAAKPRHPFDRRLGVLGFDSRRGLEIFLFTTASRTALGPTEPPIQWVSGALSLRVKRPGREADHSPPSSAEVKNAWSYTSTPQYAFIVKHRDNFTFLPLPRWAPEPVWMRWRREKESLPLPGPELRPSSP
jgi:hypothetical protein